MISNEDRLFINQLSQGIHSLEKGKIWFSSFDSDRQLDILREISNFALQAGALESDVKDAIQKSKLKPTYTPCVILLKGRLKIQISKILNLPTIEYNKIFLLTASLFSIADERRRKTKCKNKCYHWWHNFEIKEVG
ncbi:MAG: hypothetical protein GY795_08645 [Desulfobacterales bacterium]|nr:hypothetical protein [Desulfobacterales bacterium]